MPNSTAIGELVVPAETWSPEREAPDESFNYIDLSAIDQETKRIVGAREVPCAEAPSRAKQVVLEGDVLVSTVRPNLNGVARIPLELNGATASTGFCVLRPLREKLEGAYLFQWVKSPQFIANMVRRATGASYPAVSDRIVLESRMLLPPLPEQRRIAKVLDHAETLRAMRRTTLAQLDTLTQSIFHDMFGDPVTNPKGWPLRTIKEIGHVTTGSTPPSAKPDMFDGPIPFITPGDLESDSPAKRSLTEAGAGESVTVWPGATLVCCIGATIGKIGKTSVRSAFNQQINAIEWGETIDDNYGFAVLRFFKPTIISWAASTTLPILKKSVFERIEIPVPPIDLQRKFSRRLSAVGVLEGSIKASLASLDELFGTLQSRAFRGEL